MGLFNRTPSLDQLEEKREFVKIESEIASYEQDTAERKAVISELKRTYGGGWRTLLGLGKNTDTSTLKSFLVNSKQGLQRASRRW